MKDLIIYAAPAITFGLGYFGGRLSLADYVRWLRDGWERAAAQHAEAIKDMADSQSRLADALAAKNERLERIIAKGRESKSGSAQHLAKIAAGEA